MPETGTDRQRRTEISGRGRDSQRWAELSELPKAEIGRRRQREAEPGRGNQRKAEIGMLSHRMQLPKPYT